MRLCLNKGNVCYRKMSSDFGYEYVNARPYINSLKYDKIIDVSIDGSVMVVAHTNGTIYIDDYKKLLNNEDASYLKDMIDKKIMRTYVKEKEITHKSVDERKSKKYNKSFLNPKLIGIVLATIVTTSIAAKNISKDIDAIKSAGYTVISTTQQNDNFLTDDDIFQIKPVSDEMSTVYYPEQTAQSFDNRIHLSYDDRSDSTVATSTRDNYGDVISYYANMYGLDPKLMIAVACQESNGNYEASNGYAVGLMQVEEVPWTTQGSVEAYNFLTGQMDSVPITSESIRTVEGSIRTRCAITAYYTNRMNGNPLLGLMCCIGEENMNRILEEYSRVSGKTIEQIKDDPSDLGWIDYCAAAPAGDTMYVEHVLSWIGADTDISFKKPDGTINCVRLTNEDDYSRS